MRKLHDLHEVRANAVVGRVVDENRLGRGMLGNRLLHVRDAHSERNTEPLVLPGIDVRGNRAADDKRVDRAAVDVARQNNLVPRRAGGHDHRLHRRGRPVHHEECIVRPEGLRREGLGVLDDRDGMPQVVERLHRVDVHRHRPRTEILRELEIAAPALVGRDVKMGESVDALPVERICERRFTLPLPLRIPCSRRYGSCHLLDHLLR